MLFNETQASHDLYSMSGFLVYYKIICCGIYFRSEACDILFAFNYKMLTILT